MNKVLASIFTFLVLGAVCTRSAFATEGAIKLNPTSGNEPVCLTSSVYIDGAYHILMTCRGLVTPYSAEVTRYALWQYSPETKKWMFVGKLNQGKFDGVAQSKFSELMITAEEMNSPRKPSDFVVAKGSVVAFEFDRAVTPAVTAYPSASPTPTPTVVGSTNQESGSVISKVASTVLRVVVIGFVIVLVGVVVMTVITRRREMA